MLRNLFCSIKLIFVWKQSYDDDNSLISNLTKGDNNQETKKKQTNLLWHDTFDSH